MIQQKGVSLTEMLVSLGVISVLLAISTPMLILPTINKKKHEAETHGSDAYSILKRSLDRGLSAVNPLRFDPSYTLIDNQLNIQAWLSRTGQPISSSLIPRFTVQGLSLVQDSFTLELFEIIEPPNRVARKQTTGVLASRCAPLLIHQQTHTLSSLLGQPRPFLRAQPDPSCMTPAGSTSNQCMKFKIECCDASGTQCSNSESQIPILVMSQGESYEIFPKAHDLIYTTGLGFNIHFADNPASSFKAVQFRIKNTCFNLASNTCPNRIEAYFGNPELEAYLNIEHRASIGAAITDFTDGSFISLGNRFIRSGL